MVTLPPARRADTALEAVTRLVVSRGCSADRAEAWLADAPLGPAVGGRR